MSRVDIIELKGGSRLPLFAIHAAGGVISFGRLARALDPDQPLMLVKGKGLDSPDHSFEDLHELAEHYAAAIMEFFPEGPYLLCGRETFSLIEVGQRLLAADKAVPATIVFDTAPPATNPFVKRPPRVRSNRPGDILKRWYSTARAKLSIFMNRGQALSFRQRFQNGTLKIGGTRISGSGSRQPSKINQKMGVKDWQTHYPAKVVYLESEAYAHDVKRALHADRWRAFADEVEVHVTPGSHSTMFEQPHVRILAHLVCAACATAAA